MLKPVAEFGKWVLIAGFKKVRVRSPNEFINAVRKGALDNTEVQLFDADLVATWEHLYFATLNALMTCKRERSISRGLAMEVMLFASGKRQIAKSLDILGVKPDSSRIGILIIGNSSQDLESSISKISGLIDGDRDDSVLELSNRKIENIRKAFGISCEEFDIRSRRSGAERAVADLVIERIALLATHS